MTAFFVIPCGAEKRSHAAPARELYTGSMFKHTLAAALDQDACVLVLSAKHGLVELDTVLEPYDVHMGQAGVVCEAKLVEQAHALGIDWTCDVYAMLPRAYLRKLDAALRTVDVYVLQVYETARGIGEQRGINKSIRKGSTCK